MMDLPREGRWLVGRAVVKTQEVNLLLHNSTLHGRVWYVLVWNSIVWHGIFFIVRFAKLCTE